MLKVGDLVVTQNLVGKWARFNGIETVVLKVGTRPGARFKFRTTVPHPLGPRPKNPSGRMHFQEFELRLKRPPENQQKIMDMFKNPVREPELA